MCLEPDVAKMFPSADAVNEALRFLMRVTRDNKDYSPTVQTSNLFEQTDESQ